MIRSKRKYHITPDGPRVCDATVRDCKYGGAEDHSTSLLEMKVKYEQKMEITINLAEALRDAEDETVSIARLRKLSRHKDLRVRRSVSENPRVSTSILDSLASDKNEMLRSEIASNPKTSTKALEELSKDEDLLVSHKAVANPNIDKETLNRAAMSGHLFKQVAAASNSSGKLSQTSMETLLNTRDTSVCAALYKNPTVPQTFKDKAVIHPVVAKLAINDENSSSDALQRAWFISLDAGKTPESRKLLNHKNTPQVVLKHMSEFEHYDENTRKAALQKVDKV